MGRRAARAVVVALAAIGAVGCQGGGQETVGTRPPPGPSRAVAGPLPAPPSPEVVVVAEAAVPSVQVFDEPGDDSPSRSVASPQPSGSATVFLVLQRRAEMAEVLLPVRPAGASGWVKLSEVTLTQHRWRIVVELAAFRLTVFQGPDVVRVETIGVGTAGTPTPGGRWYTTELLQPPRPDGPYGTFAFGLSGFTGSPDGPAGAFGQLGLHGTNDPSTLGRNVSLGCLRMANEAITALAGQLPLGVPVDVRR
ncbi:MAG: L,D-transpeptidase [Acidimicrobiales bacterium]